MHPRDGGPPVLFHTAADVEGHLGTDGKFYLIDTARVFPPTAYPKNNRFGFPRAAPDSSSARVLSLISLASVASLFLLSPKAKRRASIPPFPARVHQVEQVAIVLGRLHQDGCGQRAKDSQQRSN